MRAARVPLTLLLLLSAGSAAADVGEYLGSPIASVRLEIEGRPAGDRRLLDLVETRPGGMLSMLDVRESVAHLFSLGRFDNVVVHASRSGAGVELLYELQPAHPVSRIEFSGGDVPGVDAGRLRQAVFDRYGPEPPLGRAADIALLIEDLLAELGYLRARATPRTQLEHDPDRAAIVFDLQPGVRARIGRIEIVGSPGETEAQLLDRLGLASGAPFEREAIDGRAAQYVADRRGRGYYETRLMVTPHPAADGATVDLTVAVVPGPRVRLVFTGDPLPSDRRAALVPIAEEGSADQDLLEDSSNRIGEFLRGQGYRDAAAPYSREEADGELVIRFHVTRGPQYRVSAVEISGNQQLPLADIAPLVRLRPGQPFEAAQLDAGVAAIENLYRRRGFASADVQAVLEPQAVAAGASHVPLLVRIAVDEQVQTVVESISFEGNRSISDAVLGAGLGLRPGEPFFLTQMALDRDAIQLQYADLGFHNATIDGNPGFSGDARRADVVFTVEEGPQLIVDHVLIVGNDRTRSETIERELQVAPGDPLGLAAVNETQRRLAALGLFRRVRITQLGHGEETARDVLVTVDEAPATSIAFGPGLEVRPRTSRTGEGGVASQQVELAPRAFFEIGRRNLFGKNRSVNLFTGISLGSNRSTSFDADEAAVGVERSDFGFSEYRVLGTFREPRVFESAADALLTATFEQQSRTSFNFARRAFSADVIRRITRSVSATGNYQIQHTELFDERINPADRLLVDRLFPQVRLSSFSSSIVRDTRDDQLDPGSGHYFSANAQVAGRGIGSEVGLFKTYLTAQLFRIVPRTRRTVFAGSVRVGLATPFSREVVRTGDDGEPVLGPDGEPIVDVLEDLPASERFFAGGDTTVRGFALDQLGTPDTIDKDGFPLGGNALVILNAEMRVPVAGGLDAVGFFDAGNVFARTSDLNLGQLRSAVGIGVRYRSPVGPIRVDLGFKLNRRDIVPGVPESLRAIHISLGQAF